MSQPPRSPSDRFPPNDQSGVLDAAAAAEASGKLADAARLYRQALAEKQPRRKFLLNRLARVLLQMRQFDEAARCLEESLELDRHQALAHLRLGVALHNIGRLDEALASYDDALAIDPKMADAHYRRGLVLFNLKRPQESLSSNESAIACAPDHAEAHCLRGRLLRREGHLPEALASFDRAIALKNDYAQAHLNRGLLLGECKRVAQALASFELALSFGANPSEVQVFKAELLLLAGKYLAGWELYEWRWRSGHRKLTPGQASIPLWNGDEPLAGKTLLIHPEVGYGDLIMFSRYVSLVEERGAAVIVEAPASLQSLLASLPCKVQVLAPEDPLPPVDFRCPIMSLPRAFKTTTRTIPARFPYLAADPDKRDQWRKKLGERRGLRIGVAWWGAKGRGVDLIAHKSRSIPLEALHPLWKFPVEFHSLQQEMSAQDAASLPGVQALADHGSALRDFSDTAALIEEMDLVISIDTSVAHLAGALGKALWVVLPFSSDYRWGLEGPTTPWYPSATLFRQASPGGWERVVAQVADALVQLIGKSGPSAHQVSEN